MKQIIFLFLLFTFSKVIKSQTEELLFEDHFVGQTLNESKWKYELGHKIFAKLKLMCYTRENVVVNNRLTITAKPEEKKCDDTTLHFTSGRIKTLEMFNFTYIEVEAKLSKGKNLQPAVWTKYSHKNNYEEIDLVELKGTESDKLVTSVHWGRPPNLSKKTKRNETCDLSEDFHIYSVNRTQLELIFHLDGTEYFRVNRRVDDTEIFTQAAYFILNISVGGRWFDKNVTTEEAEQWRQPSMEVKYVKIYGYK